MNQENLNNEKIKQLRQQKKDMEKEIAALHGDGIGSKLKGILLFFAVIILFLGMLAGMIKADVGGFGSGVLAPVIGNIRVLNKILPSKSLPLSASNNNKSDTNRIKKSTSDTSTTDAPAAAVTQTASDTQSAANASGTATTQTSTGSQVTTASQTANTQTNSNAQSTADTQSAEEAKLADYVAAYSKMDAKSAASILGNMTGDLHLVAKILANMSASKRADILANMDINIASKLTVLMAN
jgi:flagellar motility protein MotE (MotC chaperone)